MQRLLKLLCNGLISPNHRPNSMMQEAIVPSQLLRTDAISYLLDKENFLVQQLYGERLSTSEGLASLEDRLGSKFFEHLVCIA